MLEEPEYRLYYDEDYAYKLPQLLEISNPREVIKNAVKYFNDPNIKVYLSTKKDKKYMVQNPNTKKMVHFGQVGYEDYTKHKDPIRRDAYLARATKIKGSWIFNRYSPNSMSIHLLWR